MNPACGIGAVGLAGIFALYLALLWPRIGAAPAAMLAVLSSVGAGALAGGLSTLWSTRGVGRALRRATSGEPLEDGAIGALVGTIEPEGEALLSPFLGERCVAFEYDVESRSGGGGSDYVGIALAPAVVQTQRGAVRLLGIPMLDHFPRRQPEGAALANARTFLERQDFEPMEGLEKVRLFSEIYDALTDDDGRVEKHWRLGPAEQDLSGHRFYEQSVPVDRRVCAVGLYSAERGGLHSGRGFGTPLELVPGGVEKAHRTLVRGKRGAAVFGIIFFALTHAFLTAVLVLAPSGG